MTIDWPDDLRGRELILLIERAKFERWLSNEIADILSLAFNKIVDTILSPAFRTLSAAEQARKLQLFRELDRQVWGGYTKVTTHTLKEMQAYAQLEGDVAAAQIKSMLVVGDRVAANLGAMLTAHRVSSIAQLPVQGLNISEWFEAQAAGMSRETRRVIQNGLLQGKSIPEMVRSIVPPRASTEPSVYRRARSDSTAIVRTTANAVQNHAALESYQAAGDDVSDSYRFVAVRDSRTTAVCRAADGRVFRYDNDKGLRPPLHVNCVLGSSLVTAGGRIAAVSKRRFTGEVIVIRTAGNRELTCTPNHPVLTRRGWTPAKSLTLGDDVISYIRGKRPAFGNGEVNDMESSIEEIAGAWFKRATVFTTVVPISAPDFHGDVADDEVAVIGADSFLGDEGRPAVAEHSREVPFEVGNINTADLPCSRSADLFAQRDNASPRRRIGSADEFAPLGQRELLHPGDLLLMAVAGGDALLPEMALDNAAGDAETQGYSSDPDARVKQPLRFRDVDCALALPSPSELWATDAEQPPVHYGNADSSLSREDAQGFSGQVARHQSGVVNYPRFVDSRSGGADGLPDGVRASVVLSGQSLDTFASDVAFDQIVSVERRDFAGHVYNLETQFGFYSANGIITHNCRSSIIPIVRDGVLPITQQRSQPLTFGSYGEWLRQQSVSQQDSILGPTRAEWWRTGRMTLADAVDDDNRVLTLDQLRMRLGIASRREPASVGL